MEEKAYNTNPLRMFSFTVQGEDNFVEDILNSDSYLPKDITYIKAAKEEGGDTENVHYHIFLRSNKPQRYSYYSSLFFPAVLINCPIYNTKQTIDYIGDADFAYSEKHPTKEKRGQKKGGKVLKIWEKGDRLSVRIPAKGSNGNDIDSRLERVKDILDAGGTLTECYGADFGISIRYQRQLEVYAGVMELERVKAKMASREKEKP